MSQQKILQFSFPGWVSAPWWHVDKTQKWQCGSLRWAWRGSTQAAHVPSQTGHCREKNQSFTGQIWKRTLTADWSTPPPKVLMWVLSLQVADRQVCARSAPAEGWPWFKKVQSQASVYWWSTRGRWKTTHNMKKGHEQETAGGTTYFDEEGHQQFSSFACL